MLDWLDAFTNLSVLDVLGVPAQNSAAFSGTPRPRPSVPQCSANTLGTPVEHHIVNINQLKNKAEHKEHPEHRKLPRSYWEWREGLARIAVDCPPAGIDPARWGQLCADAGFAFTFLGRGAARLGWSAAALFGVVAEAPGCGGLIDRLCGARVISLGDDMARWGHAGGTAQFSCHETMSPAVRPLWELAP